MTVRISYTSSEWKEGVVGITSFAGVILYDSIGGMKLVLRQWLTTFSLFLKKKELAVRCLLHS